MPSVFLSHSHADKPFAERLATDFEKYGVKVWIDQAEIKVGDSLIKKISEGIDSMDYVAVLLSPASVNSSWVEKEVAIAMTQEIEGRKVKVLPLLIAECRIPVFLKDKLWADFRDEKQYYSALKSTLECLGIYVNWDDPEARWVQEQLEARQRDYKFTQSVINDPVFYAKLYRNRRKIEVNEDKYALILGSSLSGENGSLWYFLRNLRESKIRELLKEQLQHPYYKVRRQALAFLGEIACHDDFGVIIKIIQEDKFDDFYVFGSAARALAKVALPQDRETVLKLLQAKLPDVRKGAVNGLARIGDKETIIKLMHDDFSFTKDVVDALAGIGDRETIIKLMHDKDPYTRMHATEALAKVALPQDRETILKLLRSADPDIRRSAVDGLGKVALPQDRELVIRLLDDNDTDIRERVADALAKVGDRATIIKLLQHSDIYHQMGAVYALGKTGLPQDRKLILELLQDQRGIQQSAVKALLETVQRMEADELDILLDYLAEKAQGWSETQKTHFEALSKLDQTLYSPVKHVILD